MNKALKFNLTFAKKQDSPYDGIDFAQRISVYRPSRGPEKTIPVLAPAAWSQTAVDMLAQKYLRKAGVPSKVVQQPKSTLPPNLPDWLRPAIPGVGAEFGAETDSREVFRRIAGHWTYWGWIEGYFADGDSACNFFADIQAILALQIAAPASPQWFNTGLWWAYGILGPDQGLWAAGPGSQTRVSRQPNAYQRPQLSACFINSVQDSLLDSNGIISTVEREARIFKFGGGSGANFSLLRAAGEPLTGGGVSSGLMSWLKVLDASAGSIKSGGVTRRAAKMICLDVDHPDIQDFIGWKKREEEKVAALVVGSNVLADIAEGKPTTFDPASAGLPDTLGSSPLAIGRLDTAYEGDAYQTVSGQNANNSVRINELFMQKITGKSPDDWSLIDRISTNKRVISAKALWRQIAQTAWSSADPESNSIQQSMIGIHASMTASFVQVIPVASIIFSMIPRVIWRA